MLGPPEAQGENRQVARNGRTREVPEPATYHLIASDLFTQTAQPTTSGRSSSQVPTLADLRRFYLEQWDGSASPGRGSQPRDPTSG
jgi:hypothetical protein